MDKLTQLTDVYNWLRYHKVIKTQIDFAQLLGVNRTTINRALNGDPKYLSDSLVKLAQACKDHHCEMLSIPVEDIPEGSKEIAEAMEDSLMPDVVPVIRFVPTIPIHAYRATDFDVMEYFQSTKDDLHMSPIVQQFPGTDCYYFVNSDDMSPNLQTNDLLCLARLPEGAKVTNGDLCILNTKFQGMLERFVYDDGDALILKSTQPRWTEMRIPKDEIFSVFRILGGIRTNI